MTTEEWRAFFAPYSHIVLVANSESVKPEQLRTEFPPDTLFVFFNKVYKVLDAGFDAPCLLVARSGMMGANIVHRREVKDVLAFFRTERFLGVLNLRGETSERLSASSAFEGATVRHLDLVDALSGRYPAGKFPTSGFALTLWLMDIGLSARVVLAGFSAKRSEKWKVFDVHDWSFEQIYLRIRAGRGDITMHGQTNASRITALFNALPDVPQTEILAHAADVLANRLDDANQNIDRLMSLTKLHRAIDNFFRGLRPKTRKERYLAARKDG